MGRPEHFSEWVALQVASLNRAAAAAGWQLPGSTRISVAVEENGHRGPELWSIDDFEPLFQSVLERTTRSWVNLDVDTIHDGVLALVVVYISRQDQSAIFGAPGADLRQPLRPAQAVVGDPSVGGGLEPTTHAVMQGQSLSWSQP